MINLESKYKKLLSLIKNNSDEFRMDNAGTYLFLEFKKWNGTNLVRLSERKHRSHIRKTFFGTPKTIDYLTFKWTYISKNGTKINHDFSDFMDGRSQKEVVEYFIYVVEKDYGI